MAVIEVKIPTLGESVSEGVIARWLKQEGEFVNVDEPLIELETDKAVMEIPAESAGTISIIEVEGATVEVDQIIAKIDTEGKSNGASATPVASPETPAEPEPQPEPAKADANTPSHKLSPAVRKMVEENDLDPTEIDGTGKDGRLTKADVVNYLKQPETKTTSAPAPEPAPEDVLPQSSAAEPKSVVTPESTGEETRREPMTKIRQRIAERLVEAQQSAAILTTFNDVDMSAIMAMRKKYKDLFEQKHGVKLGFMSLFGRAVIQAIQDVPRLNAQIDGTDLVYHNHVHLGIAVSTERGLMVPVVKYADQMSLAELERAIGEMALRGRDGKIMPDELSGGTFSITNGGIFGSMLSTPLLNPPQSGILGMHRIEERPVAVNGQVEVRPMMYLALSYDHRIVDGKEAVTFLVRVKQSLEDPERMLLDV